MKEKFIKMEIFENLSLENLDGEIWKVIEEYPDYQVSNIGRIKSFKKCRGTNERILKQYKVGKYFFVRLCKDGEKEPKNKLIHRLIFEIHKEKLEESFDVHHMNKDEKYNFVENLIMMPKSKHHNFHMKGKILSEETKKKMSESRLNFKGEKSPNHKLTEEHIIQIKLLLKEGILTQKEIADMFGVSCATISKIKLEKLWSHIKI